MVIAGERPRVDPSPLLLSHSRLARLLPSCPLALLPLRGPDVRSGVAGDPGYKATAQMSVEAALCLALDRGECEASGGVLTPAAGLGHALVARLRRSGMELGVRPLNSPPKTPSRKAKGAEKPSFVA